jgi:nicotinate (nicotinamide) nucleotide adenylyltransferase
MALLKERSGSYFDHRHFWRYIRSYSHRASGSSRAGARCAGHGPGYICSGKIPPHKLDAKISSEEDRFEMVSLAIKDNPFFMVSDIELHRDGPSFTVETMEEFRNLYPEDELYFIMGMDSLLELDTWRTCRGLPACAGWW